VIADHVRQRASCAFGLYVLVLATGVECCWFGLQMRLDGFPGVIGSCEPASYK